MNSLIRIGILWCLAISTGRAQEPAEPIEASQTPTLETEQSSSLPVSEPTPVDGQPSPFRPAKSEPPRPVAAPKRIVIQPRGHWQEYDAATEFMSDLEKARIAEINSREMQFLSDLKEAGIAKIDDAEMTPTSESPILVEVCVRVDESHEKIKQFIVELNASGVERMVLEFVGPRPADLKGSWVFRVIEGYSKDEWRRLDKVVREAAEHCELVLGFAGTGVVPSRPAYAGPPESKTLVLVIDADAQQSEVVKQIVEALEKAGVATGKAAETAPTSNSPISVTLNMRKEESYEKIKQLVEALTSVGVQQMSIREGGVRAEGQEEQNVLVVHAQPGDTTDELHKIRNAAKSAATQCGLPLYVSIRGQESRAAGENFANPEETQSVLWESVDLSSLGSQPLGLRLARAKLRDAQLKLSKLRLQYNDQHPSVKALELEIQAMESQLQPREELLDTLQGVRSELVEKNEAARKDDGSQNSETARLETLIAELDDRIKSIEGTLEPAPETAAKVKVFALQHAQATDAAEVLKQVYDRGPSKIVPDARTNSVIVTGPEAQVQEIEALLLKLDEAPSAANTGTNVPAPVIPIENEAAKLVVQLEDELAQLKQSVGPESPKVNELQARIETIRKSLANTTIQDAPFLSPTDAVQWNLMASEIAKELKKDQEAFSRLHGTNGPRVNYFDEAIEGFQNLHGAWLFDEETEIAEFWEELKTKYQPLIEKGPDALRAERDRLIEKNNSENDEQIVELEILTAWATVQQRYRDRNASLMRGPGAVSLEDVAGVSEGSPRELQQQLAQLRKEYEAANQQAHQLAEQLNQSPDETKQAELRAAVQRAFTARQSLLRAELIEMQTRLLKTQRSIDMRERISDQIIQRRVEDLLNPQLKWELSGSQGTSPDRVARAGSQGGSNSSDGVEIHGDIIVPVEHSQDAASEAGGATTVGADNSTSFMNISGTGKTVNYVIDTSASMSGARLKLAQSQLKKSLRLLQPHQQFGVIFYNKDHTPLLLPRQGDRVMHFATEFNKLAASNSIDRVRSDSGTEHQAALLEALRLKPEVIYFLTDGNEPELSAAELGEIARKRGTTTIHVIEFGEQTSKRAANWLERLARQSNGEYSQLEIDDENLVEIDQQGAVAPGQPLKQTVSPNEPSVALQGAADLKAAMLSKLQGTWDVELNDPDAFVGLPPGTRVEITIEGNLLKFWDIVPAQPEIDMEAQRVEEGAMLLTLGAAGPPQQIDLVIGPNDGDQRRETQGIIEIIGDTVKLCYDPQVTKGEIKRPVAFADGVHAKLLTLKRSQASVQATELEGDWHMVELFGNAVEGSYRRNLTFRGNVWTESYSNGDQVICWLRVDAQEKRLYLKSENRDSEVDYLYALEGSRLLLRMNGQLHSVYERGLDPSIHTGKAAGVPADAMPKVRLDPILEQLQGRWSYSNKTFGNNPEQKVLDESVKDVEVNIQGDLMTAKLTFKDGSQIEQTQQLKLGEAGPPQQIDVIVDPNGGVTREVMKGIIEINKDVVRICQGGTSETDRPKVFAVSSDVSICELRRKHAVGAATELEGDWHGVAYYDHEGKLQETLPSNRSFRGDQSSFVRPGYRHDCRIKVDPVKKTLWSYSKEEDGSFTQDYYELKGNQLILRNEPGAVGYQVFERGLVRTPSVVPPATLEQKLLWRSAIVDIAVYPHDGTPRSDKTRIIGRGAVISSDGQMLSQLPVVEGGDLSKEKFSAKFDDGSNIPLKLIEETGQGWCVLQPEQPIDVNHFFEVSTTEVQLHDEVRVWIPDHSQAGSESLAPFANTVRALDRKYPALGIAVWQLRIGHRPVPGTPILDADGELLGMTITGARDLLLAIPVAELKTMFPKSFGQPSESEPQPVEALPDWLSDLQGTWTVTESPIKVDENSGGQMKEIRIDRDQWSIVWTAKPGDPDRVELLRVVRPDEKNLYAIDLVELSTGKVVYPSLYELDQAGLTFCYGYRGERPHEISTGNRGITIRLTRDE